MSAVISPCEKYRYVLKRGLGSVVRWYKPVLFIMLNPSTADAEKDDPTIRRCIAFARRESMTHLTVVNLFALRATDPSALLAHFDPIGPDNNRYIAEEVDKHKNGLIIAAWGAHGIAKARGNTITTWHGPFQCLGKTKGGAPRHPLYIKSDQPLEAFDANRLVT